MSALINFTLYLTTLMILSMHLSIQNMELLAIIFQVYLPNYCFDDFMISLKNKTFLQIPQTHIQTKLKIIKKVHVAETSFVDSIHR